MALILIIDDDVQVLALLRKVLEREGHEVIEAPNGRAGLELYFESQADLVITDIFMPEKEGVETILSLRKRRPNAKIIAISGGDRFVGADRPLNVARLLGAQRTFTKPVNLKELVEAVGELLAAQKK
jgi:CheY-like chemotaxis protein